MGGKDQKLPKQRIDGIGVVPRKLAVHDSVRGVQASTVIYSLAASAVSDINGDGKFGADDRFGIFGNYRAYYNTIVSGAGIRYVESDSSGEFVYHLFENEKAVSLFEKIIDFDTANPNLTFNKSTNAFDISNDTLFTDGRALFHIYKN